MDFEKISNEELHQMLLEQFPGQHFQEVTESNRHTVIAILSIHDGERRRRNNVQPEDK